MNKVQSYFCQKCNKSVPMNHSVHDDTAFLNQLEGKTNLKESGIILPYQQQYKTDSNVWVDDLPIPSVKVIKNKYMREIKPGVWVDVYDVLDAFDVTDGGMAHALKKILATGKRGHKDEAEDRKDILASVKRSNEIFNRK